MQNPLALLQLPDPELPISILTLSTIEFLIQQIDGVLQVLAEGTLLETDTPLLVPLQAYVLQLLLILSDFGLALEPVLHQLVLLVVKLLELELVALDY